MPRSIIRKTKVKKYMSTEPIMCTCLSCQKHLNEKNFYKLGLDGSIAPYCKECLIRMTLNSNGIFDEALLKRAMQLVNKPFYYNKFMDIKSDVTLDEVQKAQKYFHFVSLKDQWKKTYSDSQDANYVDPIQKAKANADKIEIPSAICTDMELIKKWNITDQQKINWLESEYDEWCKSYAITTKGQTELVKQICLLKWQMTQYQIAGEDIPDKLYKSFSQLLGDAGLKPIQESDGGTESGKFSWGLLIKMIEENEPILPLTEPDCFDELQLKIVGQLAKMEGFHNSITEKYDRYLDEYSVKEIEDLFEDADDDSEAVIEDDLEEKLANED